MTWDWSIHKLYNSAYNEQHKEQDEEPSIEDGNSTTQCSI